MITAYLMVIASGDIEKQTKVAEKLLKKKEVLDVSVLYGEYDIIVKIKVKNMSDLQKFVMNLRKEKGVERTNTMVAIN